MKYTKYTATASLFKAFLMDEQNDISKPIESSQKKKLNNFQTLSIKQPKMPFSKHLSNIQSLFMYWNYYDCR